MKGLKKQIVSGIITFSMLLTMLPVSAFATNDNMLPKKTESISFANVSQQDETWDRIQNQGQSGTDSSHILRETEVITYSVTGGNIYFNPETGMITDCDSDVTAASIPSVIDGVKVIGIDGWTFSGMTNLEEVVLPKSLKLIGPYVFLDCKNLKHVVIQSDIQMNGQNFYGCDKLITAGPIGGGYNIEFSWNKFIPDNAFSGSELRTIVFPDGISKIGNEAFYGCDGLESIDIPNSITEIGNSAFYGCECEQVELKLPEGLEIIGDYAFCACNNIKEIIIPDSVTFVGVGAFESCDSLEHIVIPSTVSCGGCIFCYCPKLNTAGPIGGGYDIEFGWTEEIPDFAFCGMGTVTIGESYFKSIILPDSITRIGVSAFEDCTELESIEIPNGITEIGESAFRNCQSLKTIKIPSSLKTIDEFVFSNCDNLQNVTISDGVKNLEGMSFGFSNFKSIFLPKSIERIAGAFELSDLTDIYYVGSKDDWNKIEIIYSLNDSLETATIHYNSTGPDDPGIEQPETSIGSVCFFNKWDSDTKQAYFDYSVLAHAVTDNTEISPNQSIDKLVGKYVLVKMNESSPLEISSIKPVDSKIGTVTNVIEGNGNPSVTSLQFEDGTYAVANGLVVSEGIIGKQVLYHLSSEEIVGYTELQEKTGILEEWDNDSKQLVIDGVTYFTNYITDESLFTRVEQLVGKRVEILCLEGVTASYIFQIAEDKNEVSDGLTQEELKEEYVNQHIEYYQSSYDEEIVSMLSTDGLGFLLEDAEGDFSDLVYSNISVVVADLETIEDFMDPTSYVNINWGEGKIFTIKIPDVALMDLGSSEYSVMLYQLMASDDIYNGMLDTFSVNYEKNVKEFVELISDSSLDLVKDANAAEWDDASKILENATNTICKADLESAEFATAYANFEQVANRYLDLNKTKTYLKSISTSADNAFSFLGAVLDEVDSIGKAYQYICWAESYAETSKAFKDVLKDVAIEADKMADDLYHTHSPEDLANPYSTMNRYKGLSKAIDSFITTMDSYAKDAHTSFVKEVIGKTGESCLDIVVECISDKALGGSICPPLAAINAAFSSGKLLIDLFTSIDDEQKMIWTVKSYEMITELLLKVSNRYGDNMLMEEYIDPSDIFMQPVPVTLDMKFSFATRFDESIKMYKNAMSLACDYGIEYEKSRLAYASNMATQLVPDWWYEAGATTEWQIQASTSSTAISLLAYQKNFIKDIHCHDDGLNYNHSTGIITYNGSHKVIVTACPVDVTVTAPDGTQLAYMTDGSYEVTSGYEPYFHIIPSSENEYDYIKVAVIPTDKNYHVSIDGTGNGFMNVFVTIYNGDNYSDFTKVIDCEMFANYGVTKDTTGYIDSGDKDNVLGDLVLDNDTYGKGCFVVTFDANGGELANDSMKIQTNKNGKLNSLPSNPTHINGYCFDGWYTMPIGGVLITPDYIFNNDITVYAHWVKDSIPESPSVPVAGVELNTSQVELNQIGEVYQLKADVKPADATNQSVSWVSSNPSVATVDNAGLVTALANGTSTITAETVDGNYTANCTVVVNIKSTSSSSGGSSGGGSVMSTSYTISSQSSTGGNVTISDKNASRGKIITLNVTPNEGYKLDVLTVSDKNGDFVELTQKSDLEYTFVMPSSNVTINAKFVEIVVDTDQIILLPFYDISENAWYYDAVKYIYENGMMQGISDTEFAPNLSMNRAMIVTVLHRLENTPETTITNQFLDVESNQWYTEAVQWAFENDIVNGYSSDKFAPMDNVTREQLAVILYNYTNYKGGNTDIVGNLTVFKDADDISDWSKNAISWAVGSGLLSGKGNGILDPKGTATRAEVAQIFMNYCIKAI